MNETQSNRNLEDRWIAARWKQFEGESRAGMMRVGLVIVLYSIQLLHYFFFSNQAEIDRTFHSKATWLACAGLMISLGLLVALSKSYFPSGLKFVVTSFDLILISIVASQGSGSHSPMVLVYFVLIGMSGLRFDLGLIWFTTLGSMACYGVLVGLSDPRWFDAEHNTKPIDQLITLGAMGALGVSMGQVIRLSWRHESTAIARGMNGKFEGGGRNG